MKNCDLGLENVARGRNNIYVRAMRLLQIIANKITAFERGRNSFVGALHFGGR